MKRRSYVGTRVPMTVDHWMRLGWSHEEAEGIVRANPAQRQTSVVVVTETDDGIASEPLRHHVRHSPTGFEWGYGGSGPADLARCILLDYFDLHDQADERTLEYADPGEPTVSYMDFKFEVVAGLDRGGFVITDHEIRRWIESKVAS